MKEYTKISRLRILNLPLCGLNRIYFFGIGHSFLPVGKVTPTLKWSNPMPALWSASI